MKKALRGVVVRSPQRASALSTLVSGTNVEQARTNDRQGSPGTRLTPLKAIGSPVDLCMRRVAMTRNGDALGSSLEAFPYGGKNIAVHRRDDDANAARFEQAAMRKIAMRGCGQERSLEIVSGWRLARSVVGQPIEPGGPQVSNAVKR